MKKQYYNTIVNTKVTAEILKDLEKLELKLGLTRSQLLRLALSNFILDNKHKKVI